MITQAEAFKYNSVSHQSTTDYVTPEVALLKCQKQRAYTAGVLWCLPVDQVIAIATYEKSRTWRPVREKVV